MAEPITPTNPQTTVTHQRRVVCDGPTTSKHPRVYLTMVDDAHGNPTHVVCPYCSHVFTYEASTTLETH